MDCSAETEECPVGPPPSSDLNQLVHYRKRMTPTARISIETMGCVSLEQGAGSCTSVDDTMGIILLHPAPRSQRKSMAWQASSCDSFY